MRPSDRVFWNFTAFFLFLLLLAGCALLIYFTDAVRQIWLFNWFDLVLISLATFRFAHLLTDDKIFSFVRRFFLLESREADEVPARVASRVVYEMLECLWCAGIWSALIVSTVYLLGVWGQFVVIILAVAGVGSLLQVMSKAIARE